jgi:hypothetical protein
MSESDLVRKAKEILGQRQQGVASIQKILADDTAPTHPREEAVIEGASPTPPLRPGWLVVYRDQRGVLCGGCDDRQRGTVGACRWEGNGWTVHLTDGQRLPLSLIRSVGKTDEAGQLVSAWTVKAHGYDGTGEAGA